MSLRAALTLLVWIPAAVTSAGGALSHVDVYVSGTEGYFAYRIPAIETAPDGSLLAFAEARKHNLGDPGYEKQDIDLVLRRSTDQGRTWSPMRVIEDPGELWSAANPTTIVDRQTGKVWLLYLRCKPERNTSTARPGTDDCQVIARWSSDHGETWSEPIDLTAVSRDMNDSKWGVTVIGPGGGLQLASGRLIVPAWKYAPYRDFALYSDDHGATWKRSEFVPGDVGYDECQLVELADGRVLIDMRQNAGPHRGMSVSSDQGQTWSTPYAGNPVSPVACAVERYPARIAPDQRERILWTGPKGPDRQTLVMRVSYDQGQTFGNERVIAEEPAAYSDLCLLADNRIGCLWERGDYKFITFTPLDLAFLEPADKTLSFTAADAPTFAFDTGVLQGTLRGEGRAFGLTSARHVPSGQQVSGSHVLVGAYRVFSDGKRYGNAGWEWASQASANQDGSVTVTAAAEAERPFTVRGVYRWATPAALDVEIDVTPEHDLHAFELFLASYFDPAFHSASVYVRENPQAQGKPGFMAAKAELGTWLMFPRDDAAVQLIQDGRWELPPNPVQWQILPQFGRPLAMRRVPDSGLTVLIMTRPEDCFAVAMPFETEAHYSVYFSLFGRDIPARQTARARARLQLLETPDEAAIEAAYHSFLQSQ